MAMALALALVNNMINRVKHTHTRKIGLSLRCMEWKGMNSIPCNKVNRSLCCLSSCLPSSSSFFSSATRERWNGWPNFLLPSHSSSLPKIKNKSREKIEKSINIHAERMETKGGEMKGCDADSPSVISEKGEMQTGRAERGINPGAEGRKEGGTTLLKHQNRKTSVVRLAKEL